MCSRWPSGWRATSRAGSGRVARSEILDAGNAFDLNLTRPVPVYFAYITAWAEPGGDRSIQFRPDIYGRDGTARVVRHEREPSDGPAPPWTLAP